MCTVTYIPFGNDEFILTSNRDEAPKRSATGINQETRQDKTLLFPRDPLANGTWIAASNARQLVCVLNGAFQKHQHRPPYRLSRGIMALDFFSYPNARSFVEAFNFKGIEPFTMVIYDEGNLYELRWDESQTHLKPLATNEKHIWSSCTLYSDEWQAKRRTWFAEWERIHPRIDQAAILDFHKNGGEGNPGYDVVMNRQNKVRTTSITSVHFDKRQINMRYEDILTKIISQQKLLLHL